MATYGSCCYAECPNSYSADSDAVFFKFPIDGTRRKKWIDNCGNPELAQLADRQLRGKRVCAKHFPLSSFVNPVTREQLTEKAVPFLYQPSDEPKPKPKARDDDEESEEEEEEEVKEVAPPPPTTPGTVVKRGRGRPPRTPAVIKIEVEETEEEPPVKKPKPPPSPAKSATKSVEVKEKEEASKPAGSTTPAAEESSKGDKTNKDKDKESTEPTTRGRSLRVSVKKETIVELSSKAKTPASTPAKAYDVEDEEEPSAVKEVEATTPVVKRGRGRPPTKHLTTIKKEPEDSADESPSRPTRGVKSETPAKTPGKAKVVPSEIRTSLRKARVESAEDDPTDKDWTGGKERGTPAHHHHPIKKEKEPKSIEKFLVDLKSHCVIADQWTLSGILWEAGRKMKMIAISEMDVTTGGSMRVKRCIQIFEDMSCRVLLDDADMTTHFEVTKVSGSGDVSQLLTKTALAKICAGLKNFETSDSNYFPTAVKRGHSWYSSDCSVIVDNNAPGPLCSTCGRLRSSVRRRKIREKMELEKKQNSKLLVRVQSKFGKALYSLLTDLMTEDTAAKKPSLVRPPVFNISSNNTEGGMDQREDFQRNKNGLPISVVPSRGMPSSSLGAAKRLKAKIGQEELGKGKSRPSNTNRGGRMKVMTSGDGGNEGMVEMLEQYVTIEGENGNLILQPSGGGEFTLAEGQEYELIGEADANEPMQVVESDNSHHIEIIEVDDQTMAQLTGHSVNDMFFQGSENIQVTEIDPNDPNMGQLLKVIDPSSQGFTFQ